MKNDKTKELVLLALFTAVILLMAFTNLGLIPLGVINATTLHIPVILGSIFLGPKKGSFLGFLFGLTSFLNNTFKAATASAFVFSPVIAYDTLGFTGILRSTYICFVPRILVGIVPYFVFIGIKALLKNDNLVSRIAVNGLAGLIAFVSLRAYFIRQFASLGKVGNTVIAVAIGIAVATILYFVTSKKSSTAVSFIYAGLSGAFTNTLFVMSGIYILYKNAYAEAIGKEASEVIDVIIGVITFNGIVEAVVAAIIASAVGAALIHVTKTYDLKVKATKKA